MKKYRLKQPCFCTAYNAMTDNHYTLTTVIEENHNIITMLKELKCMHWVEEIPQSVTINMGGFNVVVENKIARVDGDDVTIFVRDMIGGHYFRTSFQFGSFDAQVKEVIFSKTGCKNTETKLSDWKKVYDLIK